MLKFNGWKEYNMITDVTHHCANLKTGMVHAMDHPSTSLCGIHTGFRNKNISLEKTYEKVTCKRCLKLIDLCFQDWEEDYNIPPSNVDTFDEEIHSSKITNRHIFI